MIIYKVSITFHTNLTLYGFNFTSKDDAQDFTSSLYKLINFKSFTVEEGMA